MEIDLKKHLCTNQNMISGEGGAGWGGGGGGGGGCVVLLFVL